MSSDPWTKVGKGGRPVSFPAEAAAAFSSKSRSSRPGRPVGFDGSGGPGGPGRFERTEFPSDAAAAFGRREKRAEGGAGVSHDHRAPAGFDSAAASAFGSKQRRAPTEETDMPRRGSPGFDAAAAAAFGGGSSRKRHEGGTGEDFPGAFSKKKSVFAAAGELGLGEEAPSYGMSALSRKRAEAVRTAPPKAQTYEEMFPSLGPAAAPVAAGAATAVKGKPTLADMMRARLAEETAVAEREAFVKAEEAKHTQANMFERERLRRLHMARYTNTVVHGDEYDEDDGGAPAPVGDLDYDAYGEVRSAFVAPFNEVAEDEIEEAEYAGDEGAGDDHW